MECGWTKDYIADNLTWGQIERYCELIQKQKIQYAKLSAVSTLKAVGTAFGTVPIADFKEYLKSLEGKKETVKDKHAALDEAKNSGLPIEDK